MTYRDFEEEELLKVISKEDYDFIEDLRIPYPDRNGNSSSLWAEKHRIDNIIDKAVNDGKISPVTCEPFESSRAGFYAQSDYISGGSIQSMADGKQYDSKSQYYKSLKDGGYHIMDERPKEKKREFESDLTGRDIKNAIERLKSR